MSGLNPGACNKTRFPRTLKDWRSRLSLIWYGLKSDGQSRLLLPVYIGAPTSRREQSQRDSVFLKNLSITWRGGGAVLGALEEEELECPLFH